MAKSPHMREKFDPDRRFVAAKPFTFNGTSYRPGADFPREAASLRRLRQLHDSHYLKMTDDPPRHPLEEYVSGGKPVTGLALMGSAELKAWLSARGVVPRYGASRTQLLDKAEEVDQAEKTKAKKPAATMQASV